MKKRFRFKNKYIKSVFLIIILLVLFISIFDINVYKDYLVNKTNDMINKDDMFKEFKKEEMINIFLNKVSNYNEKISYVNKEIIEENNEVIGKPIVYIYNSHQTESYYKNALEHSIKPTVLYASYILKDYLNDYNISSIVETRSMKEYTVKNNLDYSGSYRASRFYMKSTLEEHSSLKYFIDLHRDSTKLDKTLYEKNGKRYARIMFVVGKNHKESDKNSKFVKDINDRLNSKHKGLSRGIYDRNDAIFNQDMSDKCILVELGGVDNTLEEINNTLEVFANILNDYIKENDGNSI